MTTEPPGVTVGWFNATKALDIVTKAVRDDEPCFFLGEFNLPSRSGKSRVRYQLLRVVRSDHLETAYVYLGPARKFAADQFQIVGGLVNEDGRGQAFHTVAELQDIGNELRSLPPRRELEPLPLQQMWQEYNEEMPKQLAHKSSFGLKGQLVRP